MCATANRLRPSLNLAFSLPRGLLLPLALWSQLLSSLLTIISSFTLLSARLQIAKWDEQRENNNFPARLSLILPHLSNMNLLISRRHGLALRSSSNFVLPPGEV